MFTATPEAELLFTEKDATPISADEATVKPWTDALACLDSAAKVWLSTVRSHGLPHSALVLLVLVDGVPCFATRPGSRKGRNLAARSGSVLAVAGEALDLVVEGEAVRIRDDAELRQVADAFKAKFDWVFALRDGRAHDDNLPGSPEYCFYRLAPVKAFGYGVDGLTATRWRFPKP